MSITVTAAVSGLACVTEYRFQPQLWVRPQLRTNQSGAPVAGDRGGGTAGPEASRTAKCFSQYKNKYQLKKKKKRGETLKLSYFVLLCIQ